MDNPSSDGHFPDEVHLSTEAFPPEAGNTEPTPDTAPAAQYVPPRKSGMLVYALAGLQAAIVGVIWMFLCFIVSAYWSGGGIWSVPNLFSTIFYGENAYLDGFIHSTWAGAALIVVLYGVMGVVWGCLWRANRPVMMSLYGALAGLAAYFFFFGYVWEHAKPMIPFYAPVRELQVAHILWGAALARSPRYSARIEAALSPPAVFTGRPSQEPAETVSGEVIQ